MADIKQQDVETLIELFEASDWCELALSVEGLDLFLSKDPQAERKQAAAPPKTGLPERESGEQPAKRIEQPAAGSPDSGVPEGMHVIRAPNVGTFYRAPKPDEEPYVEVGDQVSEDTEVCLVEVMKLFTPVAAGVAGKIREILMEDGQMVEYDQPMFYVEPNE